MQRKFRNVVIEHDFGFPAAFVMAALASLTFLAAMHIVEPMTGETRGADLFFEQQAPMTISAGILFMYAAQREVGVFVMLEFGPAPALHAMALLTVLAVLALMFVTGFMTGKAVDF